MPPNSYIPQFEGSSNCSHFGNFRALGDYISRISGNVGLFPLFPPLPPFRGTCVCWGRLSLPLERCCCCCFAAIAFIIACTTLCLLACLQILSLHCHQSRLNPVNIALHCQLGECDVSDPCRGACHSVLAGGMVGRLALALQYPPPHPRLLGYVIVFLTNSRLRSHIAIIAENSVVAHLAGLSR